MYGITKIFLADLSHTHSIGDTELTVPLNIGYIKAYAVKELGQSVDISLFKHPQEFLDNIAKLQPQVVGFSNYSWNTNLNLHIGRETRKALPEAMIVGGGPNIDDDEDWRRRFLKKHDYLDFLIVDGGEEPFTELIKWRNEARGDKSKLPMNLLWLEGNEVCKTDLRPLEKKITDIVSPYLEGHLDKFLEAGMVPMFESNRGCPFPCTFCAWGAASKNLLRKMDFETTLAEYEYVSSRSRARNWMLCDANFGILNQDIELAQKIRDLRDKTGYPVSVQMFAAKNVTERNLEISDILNDMTTTAISFQSLDPEVLVNIERDNISLDSYRDYQQHLGSIGHRTYSELIIPMPGESRESHIAALRELIDSGVHELHVHNLRMLCGTKINSPETRKNFKFRTRYRLIHGDAGIYKVSGSDMRIFEYEESLRETSTFSEDDLFYFRKLQFFIEFSWNIDAYGPLLKTAHLYEVHPIDIIMQIIKFDSYKDQIPYFDYSRISEFMTRFTKLSEEEWFDSEDEIEKHFAKDEEFQRLIDLEFDKLNILFSVVLLKEYKSSFDILIKRIVQNFKKVPMPLLECVADFTFKRFPGLEKEVVESNVAFPLNIEKLSKDDIHNFEMNNKMTRLRLHESPKRKEIRTMLCNAESHTLSKIINTQRFYLRDLKLSIENNGAFHLPVLFC